MQLLTSIYSVKENLSVYRVPVLDGAFVNQHIPWAKKLVRAIQKTVDDFAGIPLVPLSNSKGITIHFTPPSGEYRWHYDPNVVSAILYLNEVEGGEVDIYEDYRILLEAQSLSSAQKFFDQILISKVSRWIFSGKRSAIEPTAGGLLLLKGDRCLHSVRKIRGTSDRVSIEFAFDVPGRVHKSYAVSDSYFYSGPEFVPEKLSA
jgi:hypothetical protein